MARTIVCVKLRFKAGSLDFPPCASEFGNELHTVTQELRVPPAADRRFVRSSATQGTTRAAARVVEACHNAMTSAAGHLLLRHAPRSGHTGGHLNEPRAADIGRGLFVGNVAD